MIAVVQYSLIVIPTCAWQSFLGILHCGCMCLPFANIFHFLQSCHSSLSQHTVWFCTYVLMILQWLKFRFIKIGYINSNYKYSLTVSLPFSIFGFVTLPSPIKYLMSDKILERTPMLPFIPNDLFSLPPLKYLVSFCHPSPNFCWLSYTLHSYNISR